MRHYNSVVDFEGAGSFKPTRDSRVVPLLPPKPPPNAQPWRERVQMLHMEEADTRCEVPGWRVSQSDGRSGRVRCEATGSITCPRTVAGTGPTSETFCALDWREEEQPECDEPAYCPTSRK